MKTGSLYVDGYDVYKQFGMYVVEGGWNELVAMPPLKSVTSNDWQEEDGIEADLSAPVLNTREVSIKFAITGLYSSLFDFLDILSDGAYHTFICNEIGRSYKLRLVQQPNLKAIKLLGQATLKFADDFPLDGYTYKAPNSSVMYASDYTFDGLPFTSYGVRLLKGSYDEIVKSSAVKTNLLRNIAAQAGVEYDAKQVTYKSKDVKLYCLMRADDLDELWRNYDAFLYDLIRPNERTLWVDDLERDFLFHYKSCQVTKFCPTDRIWLQFTLTVTFTQDFRIGEEDIVLASEDGIVVFTEDNTYAIELRPDKYLIPSVRLVNDRMTLRFTGSGGIRFNN